MPRMPRCHNCRSPYHYSDHCPNPAKADTKCHKCQGRGHKADQCPKCFGCGQFGHYSDKCRNPSSAGGSVASRASRLGSVSSSASSSQLMPLASAASAASVAAVAVGAIAGGGGGGGRPMATLVFDGMWGDRSAFVHPDCGLYQLKRDVIQGLLVAGIVQEQDLDDRNRKMHIEILRQAGRGARATVDSDEYKRLHNTTVSVSHGNFGFSRNVIQLENVGAGCHYSLVFKRDAGFDRMDRQRLWAIIDPIVARIKLPDAPAPAAAVLEAKEAPAPAALPAVVAAERPDEADDDGLCPICFDQRTDTALIPCGHVICGSCSDRCPRTCPVCRTVIATRQHLYRV